MFRNFRFIYSIVFASLWVTTPTWAAPGPSTEPTVRTKAQRDALTPQQVLDNFRSGNERFARGERKPRNLLEEQRATSAGQHPSAVIVSCIDSRAPAEFLFDKGIGETFNARIAGNVVNPDIAGSLEYSCAVAGAKLIVVLGHSDCGAVKGAIDHAELGNLTDLLKRIHPAIAAVGNTVPGEQNSKNAALVTAVTRSNVKQTVLELRRLSPILSDLEKKGKIKIVGALYNTETGKVEFVEFPGSP